MNSTFPAGDRLPATNLYRARWIVPIEQSPLRDGWIQFVDGNVVAMGKGKPDASSVDLGDVALLPGLVNAHTHLEFSDVQVPVGQGDDGASLAPLHQWIGMVIAQRGTQTPLQKANAIESGIAESVAAGVRLIGEITTPPAAWDLTAKLPLEVISFSEVIGLSGHRFDERFTQARAVAASDPHAGFSPHAPYSLSIDNVGKIIDASVATQRSVAMHVAESPDERDLVGHGRGSFADALRSIGVWEDGLFPWHSLVEKDVASRAFLPLIDQLSRAPRAMLIHGNDLQRDEIEAVAKHSSLSVVMCPRTHAFFKHDRHPIAELLVAGVRVALGTDSRASNPDLNLWSEVQHLLNNRPDLSPDDVLRCATMHGADAMGRSDVGRFSVKRKGRPGMVSVATQASSIDQLYESLARQPVQPVL